MEACWLLALIMVPIYFSLLSARHFEPDKAVVLRSLVLVLLAAWAVKIIERGQAFGEWPRWRDWRNAPMIIPILVYVAIFLFSSATSIMPRISFLGGYNRLQGTYTNLSYIVLSLAVIANLRRREQFDRLMTVAILTSLPVAGYGIIQHLGIDPLPWKGDVITRVASTMGNSIFVAAYLILVVPLVLFRLVSAARTAVSDQVDRQTPAWLDSAWAGAMVLLVIGQLALLNGVLKLGALVYVLDLSTWWLYPFAVIAVGSTFPLLTMRLMHRQRGGVWPYLPGVLLVFLAIMMLAQGMLTAEPCSANNPGRTLCLQVPQSSQESRTNALDFRTWLLFGYGSFFVFYLLLAALPRRSAEQPSRLLAWLGTLGLAGVAAVLMVTTLFTQSRGPILGLIAALIVFWTLVLIQGRRSTANPRIRRTLSVLLGSWAAISLAGLAFLLILNIVPGSFQSLRANRYINRLSNIIETEGGTGKVRMLIWRGDGITRGAVDLILDDPLRTIIGWGPETMFVAYNPFYPPDLGHYESRGASPDRSHQALLDELVHKGALGLSSHLLVIGSFMMLMLRFLRIPRWANLTLNGLLFVSIAAFFYGFLGSPALGLTALVSSALAIGLASALGYDRPIEQPLPFTWEVFFIASLSVLVANFVETFFGIPIVSTLTYTWGTIGLAVVAGALAGVYTLGRQPAVAPAAATEVVEEQVPAQSASGKKGRRQARGTQARARQGRAVAAQKSAPIRWIYPLIGLLALVGIWFWNIDVTYADMRFNQGQQWADGQSFDRELLAYAAYSDALRSEPHEDFYYLYYGRTLLALAQIVGQQQAQLVQEGKLSQEVMARQPTASASLADLPDVSYKQILNDRTAYTELARWFLNHGSFEILNYARLAMDQARQLSPLNKDHYANLGRIYATWYRSTKDPQKLDLAIESYEKAHEVAPQDVVLMGQWASLVAMKDPQQAEQILREAIRLDEAGNPAPDRRYAENFVRLGEVLRARGDLQGAAAQYAEAASIDPRVFGRLIDLDPGRKLEQEIRSALAKDPALLRLFAQGYGRYLERKPENLDAHLTYTTLLSDALDYRGALEEAQRGLQIAEESLSKASGRQQESLQEKIKSFRALINYLQQHTPVGG